MKRYKKRVLNEAGITPPEQAKQLHLSYAGFGRWHDAEGNYVAKTIKDKLVRVSPKAAAPQAGTSAAAAPPKRKRVSNPNAPMPSFDDIENITNDHWRSFINGVNSPKPKPKSPVPAPRPVPRPIAPAPKPTTPPPKPYTPPAPAPRPQPITPSPKPISDPIIPVPNDWTQPSPTPTPTIDHYPTKYKELVTPGASKTFMSLLGGSTSRANLVDRIKGLLNVSPYVVTKIDNNGLGHKSGIYGRFIPSQKVVEFNHETRAWLSVLSTLDPKQIQQVVKDVDYAKKNKQYVPFSIASNGVREGLQGLSTVIHEYVHAKDPFLKNMRYRGGEPSRYILEALTECKARNLVASFITDDPDSLHPETMDEIIGKCYNTEVKNMRFLDKLIPGAMDDLWELDDETYRSEYVTTKLYNKAREQATKILDKQGMDSHPLVPELLGMLPRNSMMLMWREGKARLIFEALDEKRSDSFEDVVRNVKTIIQMPSPDYYHR